MSRSILNANWTWSSLRTAGSVIAAGVLAAGCSPLAGQSTEHVRQGVVSDWTQHHMLFPDSKDKSVMSALERDPRWTNSSYLHHPEIGWRRRHRRPAGEDSRRDWSVSLGTATYGPLFDYTFSLSTQAGYGSVNSVDLGGGQFLATVGTLTNTAGVDLGTYPLYPGGPGETTSPQGAFDYNDVIYYLQDPPLDIYGLLFTGAGGLEINIWGNSADNYSYYDHINGGYVTELHGAGTMTMVVDPGGGQTFPAKYVFDVTAPPSCTNDYVVIGIANNPASGGQANIMGLNDLYSTEGASTPTPYCGTSGPSVMFAYASGTGEVPSSVTMSQLGTQLAYIENLTSGSAYFHVLTIGTTGTNGTSATDAAIPGTGNNAVDQTVLLSPDGGVTTQSSTTAPFVVYTGGDSNDVAYATTYSWASGGSGYLYKIGNVFSGTPTIVWSAAVDAVPSTPVYDTVSNKVFFTDSAGRIDYVLDSGATPSVMYGPVVAAGTTSENPVTVDVTNELIYAEFNSNGTNAIVVQAPTSLATTTTVPVGSPDTNYTGPYDVDFNYAWFSGSGTPVLYVAGTGTGILPTLYGVGFTAGGALDPTNVTSAALATGAADASPVSEFYNAALGTDYLFVGVSNNCVATSGGGTAGCVMSLDITSGFPTIDATTTALAASGGTTGIVVDNNSSVTQASSIYYATKTGNTLVKATQSGLN